MFKDKQYYIAKTKSYLGMAATAIAFVAIVFIGIALA